MSKIDEYKLLKARADRFRAFLESATSPQCDKFGGTVVLKDTFKGYYGSSSCRSWPDDLIKAVIVEIQPQLKGLIRAAVITAEKEAERARKAAEAEAREVLQEVLHG